MRHHSMPWPAWFLCLASGTFAFQLHGQEAFRARLDPILSPGLVSGHTHAVFGGINFGSVVTTDSLAQSRCTTIENILDKSAYWTNPPYGRNANGTFSALRNVELSIYYRLSDGAPVNIFPENFRMIVGNASATSDVTTVANTEAYTSYQCQNYIPPHDVTGQWDFISGIQAFPDVNCTELKMAITFPNCWNGEPDSSDHRSHVAYGSGPSCPSTHLKRIPQITFESIYYADDYDIKDIFLATGDNTGYTIHADYAFGWENGGAELMAAMQDPTCQDSQEINPSLPPDFGDGICQTFTPYFNKTAAQACAADLTSQIPQEEVGIAQPVPSLPGCNKPWSGSGLPDTKPICSPAPETPKIGNPSRIFSWAESNANVPPVNIAIYDGFNQAPIQTTTPATSVKATATATASSISGVTPTGPASGTMFLTTGQNWDGTRANWQWTNGVCKTLTSPFLNDLGSAGPNSGTCTFYNQANCQGISLFTFTFPGMTGLGSKGDQAQSFKCI